jgi:hypothetical protein
VRSMLLLGGASAYTCALEDEVVLDASDDCHRTAAEGRPSVMELHPGGVGSLACAALEAAFVAQMQRCRSQQVWMISYLRGGSEHGSWFCSPWGHHIWHLGAVECLQRTRSAGRCQTARTAATGRYGAQTPRATGAANGRGAGLMSRCCCGSRNFAHGIVPRTCCGERPRCDREKLGARLWVRMRSLSCGMVTGRHILLTMISPFEAHVRKAATFSVATAGRPHPAPAAAVDSSCSRGNRL